uniref:Uncharacterized protein n=1 Tax=Oryzias sinensis TaxID=183150 RepID=A0A8C7XGU2_9TELE
MFREDVKKLHKYFRSSSVFPLFYLEFIHLHSQRRSERSRDSHGITLFIANSRNFRCGTRNVYTLSNKTTNSVKEILRKLLEKLRHIHELIHSARIEGFLPNRKKLRPGGALWSVLTHRTCCLHLYLGRPDGLTLHQQFRPQLGGKLPLCVSFSAKNSIIITKRTLGTLLQ